MEKWKGHHALAQVGQSVYAPPPGGGLVQFTLNGKLTTYKGDPDLFLYEFLRDEAGVTSVKRGCAGEGVCGYCTVEFNDKTALSCHTTMKEVKGATVTTIEGWEPRICCWAFLRRQA